MIVRKKPFVVAWHSRIYCRPAAAAAIDATADVAIDATADVAVDVTVDVIFDVSILTQ